MFHIKQVKQFEDLFAICIVGFIYTNNRIQRLIFFYNFISNSLKTNGDFG